MHSPTWFKDGEVVVSTALTCGINKDGHELYLIDPKTGKRTGKLDDQLAADVKAIKGGRSSGSVVRVKLADLAKNKIAVPVYYDGRYHKAISARVTKELPGFKTMTIREMVKKKLIETSIGHGSPSADVRSGTYPYIKVSDLRAGHVNINPTNMVPSVTARKFWKGNESGLQAFDLISPSRASKNIGDFCVLMPGQEQIVLTKEVIVLRPGVKAQFDSFYLLWALSLTFVRDQWNRVIFFQTNREDVGSRFLEIELPVPPDRQKADGVSEYFREYFETIASARSKLAKALEADGNHHFFVSAPTPKEDEASSSNT